MQANRYSPCLCPVLCCGRMGGLQEAVQAASSESHVPRKLLPKCLCSSSGKTKSSANTKLSKLRPHKPQNSITNVNVSVEEPCTSHAPALVQEMGKGPAWAADAKELPQPLHIPESASSELWLARGLCCSSVAAMPLADPHLLQEAIPLPVPPERLARGQLMPPDGDSSRSLLC